MPTSARSIRDIHNLDTNAQTLEFTTRAADVRGMVAGLRPVELEDKSKAAELSKELGWAGVSEAFVVCSEPLNGALIVDPQSGRAIFRTPVDWADDDCSKAT